MSGQSYHTRNGDVLTIRGLAFISKDRPARINAIAEYLSQADYDVVCLQELWIYKDYEHVRGSFIRKSG
jgi:sphingomyelin phosphodiesterase 2